MLTTRSDEVAMGGVSFTPSPADVRLEARGIVKRFGDVEVLAGVDLALRAGRVTALLGPNGSGKTTLTKILLGLVRPTGGRVLADGADVTGTDAYRARIGYMPQRPRLPEHLGAGAVLDLVESLRPGAAIASRERVLDAFALGGYADRPLGVCSGGQRQRVNAAVAFRFDPDVLLLDEPTAGLDPVASSALKDRILTERGRGRAVLVTSHVLAELEELADDVVFLLDGKVRWQGTLDTLKASTAASSLERAVAALMRADAGSAATTAGVSA